MLAPVVMGALGQTKRQQKIDSGGLSGLLEQEVSRAGGGSQLGGLLSLLDTDKDGSVIDDVAKIGSRLLGGFLGKK
jgi:hypothetical protein